MELRERQLFTFIILNPYLTSTTMHLPSHFSLAFAVPTADTTTFVAGSINLLCQSIFSLV